MKTQSLSALFFLGLALVANAQSPVSAATSETAKPKAPPAVSNASKSSTATADRLQEEMKLLEEEIGVKMAMHEKGTISKDQVLALQRERLRLKEQIAAEDGRTFDGLNLQPGRLEEVVARLVEQAGGSLPNIIFGPGAKDLKITAPLRLMNVRAVDALALVAASAGGTLEPIYSPITPDQRTAWQAIGYRIVAESASELTYPLTKNAEQGSIGVALAINNGKLIISEVMQGSPAERQGVRAGEQLVAVGEEEGEATAVQGFSLDKVAELIRGIPKTVVRLTLLAPGASLAEKPLSAAAARTVSVSRELRSVALSINPYIGKIDPSRTLSLAASVPRVDRVAPADRNLATYPAPTPLGAIPIPTWELQTSSTDSVVKIYALGTVFTGADINEKQKSLVELIASAFQTAGFPMPSSPKVSSGDSGGVPGSKSPAKETATLHFHLQSKVLIVKAMPKEHELIGQVLDALDNVTQQTNVTQPPAK
ncbi:MAG: PDZ domain-containing protein [Verrucomicrobiota bacterium]|nr:PDZ domain-containing protein [Verrucomicrobiota bacterium]